LQEVVDILERSDIAARYSIYTAVEARVPVVKYRDAVSGWSSDMSALCMDSI
jgi:hypothetical protein